MGKKLPFTGILFLIQMIFGIRSISLHVILLAAVSLISCQKEDGSGLSYNIEARLYSISTSVSDPGVECELYGNIWSYPKGVGGMFQHDHFQHSEDSYFEMGLVDSYVFAETPITVKIWKDVKETDLIIVRIKLFEDDIDVIDTDDTFGDVSFEIPVDEIVSGVNKNTGYYEKAGLKVYSGTEYIDITFRFLKEN